MDQELAAVGDRRSGKRPDAKADDRADLLSHTLEALSAGIYAVDSEWRGTVVNAAAEQHFGRSRAELIGKSMFEALPVVRGTAIERALRRAMEERVPVTVEAPSAVRPGRLVEINVSPTQDGGLACIFTDVTARKLAEQALEESQSFLWLVLNGAPNGFYAVDRDGVTTMVNRAGLRMLGFSAPEEVIGRKLHTEIHHTRPDGSPYPVAECPIYRCAADGAPAHMPDELFFRADGTPFPVEYWAEPIFSDGELRGAICIFNDISDRKKAQEIERRFKEELEALVAERTAQRDRIWRLSTDTMVISDEEGRIVTTNPAFTDILGWSQEEIVGQPGIELLHPDDLQSALQARERLSQGEKIYTYECRVRCKDGSYRALDFAAVRHEGWSYAVGRDVTAERESAEALRNAEAALRQAQKMEAVGQLTGGVAHDFNNMLAIIIGSLDLARRRLERGVGGVEACLDNAREGAERAAALTQRLLAFSRQQPLAPQVLSLNRLVSEISEMLRRTLGETVELETVLMGGLWLTHADPHQLETALVNLAVNARDAMPEGGKLTVETANCYLDDAYTAKEVGVQPGQYVMIALTDTGGGMPAETLAKVFDPFFTTKPVGKGTGLGLSMVYGFVKQSGGHVKIYSEVGQGTTVKIYLPRHFGAADDDYQPRNASNPVPVAARGEVVLVVEDDDRVRQMSVEALRELGYLVFEAGSGPEALRLAANLSRLDLLFTDVVMAGMSGRQLADAMRSKMADLKVLYTTGYTRNAVVHNGVLDAGVAFLPKPFSVADLAVKVRAVLDA